MNQHPTPFLDEHGNIIIDVNDLWINANRILIAAALFKFDDSFKEQMLIHPTKHYITKTNLNYKADKLIIHKPNELGMVLMSCIADLSSYPFVMLFNGQIICHIMTKSDVIIDDPDEMFEFFLP